MQSCADTHLSGASFSVPLLNHTGNSKGETENKLLMGCPHISLLGIFDVWHDIREIWTLEERNPWSLRPEGLRSG